MQDLAFTVARRLRESWSRVAVLVLAMTIVTAPLELVLGPSLYPVDPRLAAQRMITLLAALGLVTVRGSGPEGRHRRAVAWAGVAGAGLALLASAVVLRAPLPVAEDARRHLAGVMGLATAAGVMVFVLCPALRTSRPRYGPLGLLGWVVGVYVAQEAAAASVGLLVRSQVPNMLPGTPIWWTVGALAQELAMVLCVLALVGASGVSSRRELGLRWPPGTWFPGDRVVLVGVVIVSAALVLDIGLNWLASLLGVPEDQLGNAPQLAPGVAPPTVLHAATTLAILPAVTEELFFRGFLLGVLLRVRQPLWLAVLLSTGLFAMGHLDGGMTAPQLVNVAVALFVTGSLFALAYRWTGSLYPGMLAHALFNLPTALGLALGASTKGEVIGLLLTAGIPAGLMLLVQRVLSQVQPAPGARRDAPPSRIRGLTTTLVHRLNPTVQVGAVQLSPVAHVVAIGILWLCFGAAVQAPDALGLALLLYVLAQGGRAVYEGARTVVALRYGRRVLSARLAPLLTVQFSQAERRAAERWVGAIGPAALMLYGFGLLVLQAALGSTSVWPAVTQETVALLGCVYCGNVVSLVPLPGLDGEQLWGRTWSARPVWLSSLPGLLVGLICPVLVAVQFPTGYLRSFLASVSQPYPLAVMAVWMLSAFAIACRLGLGRDGAAGERLRAETTIGARAEL